jgi:hypothetical protein
MAGSVPVEQLVGVRPEALDDLRTAVMLLGLLSVPALAVAVYALIKSQEATKALPAAAASPGSATGSTS